MMAVAYLALACGFCLIGTMFSAAVGKLLNEQDYPRVQICLVLWAVSQAAALFFAFMAGAIA